MTFEINSLPSSTRITSCSPLVALRFQHFYDLLTPHTLIGLDGKALPTKIIDYRQRPESPPIEEGIGAKVHGPTLVKSGGQRPVRFLDAPHSSFLAMNPEIQALKAVEPVIPLVVDPPPFSSQEHVDPSVAISDPCRGDVLDSHPEAGLPISFVHVSVTGTGKDEDHA